jgi:hypothetical protein
MNASWYRQFLLVPLTLLLTLTLFTPALAAPPEFITIVVDETVPFGDCAGFTVIEHVEGKVKISTHTDKDGNVTMEIARFSLRHTFVNSETGASLTSPDAGIDKITVNQDGSGTVAVIGVVSRIAVPGEGVVFVHVGKIVFDLNTGDVLFVAGPHDDFADLLPALCSALG